jgi:hypothetical protein
MVLFLRNKENKTIVEVDLYKEKYDDGSGYYLDCMPYINIPKYSDILIKLKTREEQVECIDYFDKIDKLRMWLNEVYKPNNKGVPDSEFGNVKNEMKSLFLEVANKYDLYYVED